MKHIAFFIPSMEGGGAERVVINLLEEMLLQDVNLDLILAAVEGPLLSQVPKQVRIIDLAAGRVINAILPLCRYLRQYKPQALISHMSHTNVISVLAKDLAVTKTELILVEHNTFSASKSKSMRAKLVPPLMKLVYPRANHVVGVSQAVSDDLEIQLSLKKGTVKTIYNPVVNENLISKAKAPLKHSWFQEDAPPIFVAVGRLTAQKDFVTLIKAFALLRQKKIARLMILGEGELRNELEMLIEKLGIGDDVSMPGFVANPYKYMNKANAFILSSLWEGLPTVLIEALACGCPVISTDCPSGPREILDAGKYGELVPMGDVEALFQKMLNVLHSPVDKKLLTQRAMYFSFDKAASRYLNILAKN
ncbi:glycosyltransferase [Calothrix sp. CCY 0018]|uniref:glycosyltransferase n=1 Tax=Calothrix sp. CCY 0018 TaxID=3103864 RepID=UPI0039C73422